jgi:hypothetical protein
MEEAQSLIRELLDVPQGYHVLFLGIFYEICRCIGKAE